MPFDFDLLVIGAGSGGVRLARTAAGLGAKVAVVEGGPLGGTCVNVGCVPKKLLVYASEFPHMAQLAGGFGFDFGSPSFDWSRLIENKNNEILRLNGIYENLLHKAGVEIINGWARFVDAHTIRVNASTFSARYVVIATGGKPFVPHIPGHEHVITSNEVFFLPELPKRVSVVGGGYIAVEFAGIFNGLGVQTELVYRRDLILRGFDNEVRRFVSDQIEQSGVAIRTEETIEEIHKQADGSLQLNYGSGDRGEVDLVLCATGRIPNTHNLGLEPLGVQLKPNGAVLVDEAFRSSVPHILAIGDVIDRVALTPVALAEGMFVAHSLFGETPEPLDYDAIPTAVFCQPNIACVGLTEETAVQKFGTLDIYTSAFRPMKHTLGNDPGRMFLKLIVSAKDQVVVGAHMVGQDAGEIVQGLAIAIKAGLTKRQFDRTIGIHPTAAEEFVTLRQPTRQIR
ncbi:MAG: glutathione-disulfide reductase [Acidobacteria bacterium]|nr:glutathione-disulfide reductase [Acidobacteriota bacterium]MCB9397024.1 glutathione-disulfide reductase [Acidobacteriota bacterium]